MAAYVDGEIAIEFRRRTEALLQLMLRQRSTKMKLRKLRFVRYACALACTFSWASILAESAKVSPPDVGFTVSAERDVVIRGNSLDIVISITNRSEISLENLQLVTLPKDSKIHCSQPALSTVEPFGSQSVEAQCKVDEAGGFQAHRLVFVLSYVWRAKSIPHSSTQQAILSVQVNREFEEEAKGLPGGTAALLYLILPIMTMFLSYEIVDSLRRDGELKIPEFKAAYLAPAFLLAILFNFLLIIEWQSDQSLLYGTPQRFATALLLLVAAGAVIPSIRWIVQLYIRHLYAFNKNKKEASAEYLRKALHQSETGEVRWRKAEIGGEEWEGALLRQPDGAMVLGACLQISAKAGGKITAQELKQIVDDKGVIANRMKLLEHLKAGAVTLDFKRKVTQSGNQIDVLFVTCESMTLVDGGAESERIVTFID